jgi:peroxiredoxin
MRPIIYLLTLSIGLILSACQPGGLIVDGQISNAANLQVFLDEVRLSKASNPLEKTTVDASGQFKLEFPEGLPAGIYNLRVGAKRINLVLDGNEKQLTVNGDLNTLNNYQVNLSGSASSQTVVDIMQGLYQRSLKANDIATFVDTVQNAHLAAFVAYSALGPNVQPEAIAIQDKALEKLTLAAPDAPGTAAYEQHIANLKQQAAAKARQAGPIAVGMEAPDITLPDPSGREYSLSDLRGKVVLLDFWASWCGPCRRENPNVVNIYNRYKDQGFTVFSVSLDGLDTRTKARYQPSDIPRAMEGQKERWVNAIKQDGLLWEYHVSDLKKWESAAGQLYGVRSIPRTFLIDREGRVAAVNVRGEALEPAVQELL